jgi:hypothetical protein
MLKVLTHCKVYKDALTNDLYIEGKGMSYIVNAQHAEFKEVDNKLQTIVFHDIDKEVHCLVAKGNGIQTINA